MTAKTKQKLIKIASSLALFAIFASIISIPLISQAALCDDLAQNSSFLQCGSTETTFTNFQGGLTPPSAEGYAPELTQASTAREFILQVTNFILGFLGLAAVLAIVYGGVMYVSAGGEEDRATKGKKSIMYSVIGLIVVMSSWAIVNTVIFAPSGSDRGSGGIASQSGAGVNGQTALGERDFSVAARRIQALSREFIASYENYLKEDQQIQDYYAISSNTSFGSASAVLDFLKQKEQILLTIENQAAPLGALQEISRINRLVLRQFTVLTSAAIEQQTNPAAQWGDMGNALFGLAGAAGEFLEGIGNAIIGTNVGVASGSDRANLNRGTLANAGQAINLSKANKLDFKITTEDKLIELAELISPIMGGEVLYITEPTTENLVEKDFSLKLAQYANIATAESDDIKISYELKNPTLVNLNQIKGTSVGIAYEKAFKSMQAAKDAPSNQTIKTAVDDLGDLYTAVEGLQFIDAVINASQVQGNAPLTVTFDALKSLDPNGQTIDESRIFWDLDGDGEIDGEPAAVKNFTFNDPGTYRVRLHIKSDTPESILDGFNTMTIIVNPPDSHINLNYSIGGQTFPIMKWQESGGNKELVIDKNSITVTLEEAQSGITFDASNTRDKFFEANKINRFTWDFGDNSTFESSTNPRQDSTATHSYAEPGNYTLTLEVEDETGAKDRKLVTVVVRDTAARIEATPGLEGNVGDEFTFDGGNSKASTGQITGYKWTIQRESPQGGQPITLPNEETIKYTFDSAGTYRISLEVEDSTGNPQNNDTDEIRVLITSKPPTSQFSYSVPQSNMPHVVHFDGSRSFDPDGGGVDTQSRKGLEYKWVVNAERGTYTFDPPTTPDTYLVDNSRPVIKFNKKGEYTVGLQVKDQSGQESTLKERTIRIDKVLGVQWDEKMTVSSQLKEGEARMNFKATTENAAAYEIRYGDGEKDNGEVSSNGTINTTHTYQKAGDFDVTLLVFDEENDETIISRKVFVGDGTTPISVIRIGVNDNAVSNLTNPAHPLIVNRKDLLTFDAGESINLDGSGRRLDYQWDFNDNNISTKKLTQRSYKELSPITPGYYVVKLTVTDKDTLKNDTDLAFIRVIPEPPSFLGMTAVPQNSNLTTPVPIRVEVQGAEDPDGEITQYRWWYYDITDPENELGQQITTTPSTIMNIGTKGKEGDEITYRFGAEIIDNENYKFSTDDLADQGAIPSTTVTNGPNKPPIAEFTVDRTNILAGETINFSSGSRDPDGRIVQYIWDVEGDGFHNNKPTPESTISYQYKKANKNGTKVKLKVIDDNYAEAISSPVTIYIDSNSKPPTAAFKSEQVGDLEIKFTNNSTADPDTSVQLEKYVWDFDISSTNESADSDGDGQKDNDFDSLKKDPVFKYESPGVYRVKLTVEDTDGNTDEVIQFVNVKSHATTSSTATTTNTTDPLKAQFPTVKPSADSIPAPEARLLSNPPSDPDNKIHLSGEEGNVTFDFTGSIGDIIEISIDKNVYYDTNGNGKNDDDQDFKGTILGTWTTNFQKSFGKTRVKLTVIDSLGRKDSVEKDIIFDEGKTSSPTSTENPLLGPGGKISGNIFTSFQDISGMWLILGSFFAILSLTFARLRE